MDMRCWGSSDPHSVYRLRLAARWAAPSAPQVSLLLTLHVLGRQQACSQHVKQHNRMNQHECTTQQGLQHPKSLSLS